MSSLSPNQRQNTTTHTSEHIGVCGFDVSSTSPCLAELVLEHSVSAEGSDCSTVRSTGSSIAPPNELALYNASPTFSHIQWRILPLLLDALKQQGLAEQVAPGVHAFLTKKALEGSIHEMLKTKQLNALLEILSEHQIPVILLKGTAFSNWLYNEKVPRLSSDLDILVRSCDWDKTVAILSSTMTREAKPVAGVFDDLYEISFKSKSDTLSVEIDLHQHLTHPSLFDIDLDGVWARSIMHPAYQNEYARMMTVSDALIHQALHSFKDAEYKTYNLIDTAFLLRKEPPELDALFALAKSQRADVALYGLLIKLADATHDEVLTTYLADCNISRWRKFAFKHLSSKQVSSHDVLNKTLRYRLLQFGFHAFVSTKPWSMLKLQLLYLKGLFRRSKYN
ncbi:MAG: nucleotidyltransferase family protein [Glaciecola sp.]|nr:nucleotidyltransferase family protein [Glaciecola sp.]MDG1815521.1 nucleotidyltransferase family protein [Glaciecola sp.]MDG2099765.1 nucleotidyltransferase family protein [Glaciecola sp.]